MSGCRAPAVAALGGGGNQNQDGDDDEDDKIDHQGDGDPGFVDHLEDAPQPVEDLAANLGKGFGIPPAQARPEIVDEIAVLGQLQPAGVALHQFIDRVLGLIDR